MKSAMNKEKDDVWKKLINYLENKTPDLEIPKLPAKLKLGGSEISDNLLYRVIELNNKDLSRKKVKQLVIPRKIVPVVLKVIHNSSVSSHQGKDKTYNRE